jgi:hypothetical protein
MGESFENGRHEQQSHCSIVDWNSLSLVHIAGNQELVSVCHMIDSTDCELVCALLLLHLMLKRARAAHKSATACYRRRGKAVWSCAVRGLACR